MLVILLDNEYIPLLLVWLTLREEQALHPPAVECFGVIQVYNHFHNGA